MRASLWSICLHVTGEAHKNRGGEVIREKDLKVFDADTDTHAGRPRSLKAFASKPLPDIQEERETCGAEGFCHDRISFRCVTVLKNQGPPDRRSPPGEAAAPVAFFITSAMKLSDAASGSFEIRLTLQIGQV